MLWSDKDVVYVVNANSPVQKLKMALGWSKESIKQALDIECRIISLLARGVIDSDSFYLSDITREFSLLHKRLFQEGLLLFSAKGRDSFKENLERLKDKYSPSFRVFHDRQTSIDLLNEILALGIPYNRPGSSGTVLGKELKKHEAIEETEEIIGNLPGDGIPPRTDFFIRLLHGTIIDERGNEPLLPYYIYREMGNRGYKDINYVLRRGIEINLLRKFLPIVANSHSTKHVSYGMLNVPGIDSRLDRYDCILFLRCMRLLGIDKTILSLNDIQISRLKGALEFQLFLDEYFQLIDRAKSIEEAEANIRRRVHREGSIEKELFIRIIEKYSPPNRFPQQTQSDGLDLRRTFLNYKDIPFIRFKDSILEEWKSHPELMSPADRDTRRRSIVETGGKVFIIHGHDHELKIEVQLLLTRADVTSVVLHEQPDLGRTIIDKLVEEAKDASYAIALFSPDDSLVNGSRRPRQNVMLEVGYFIGKLGKDRVRLIVKGDIEIPSDLSGILYEKHDRSGAWRMRLLKELQAVGISVDIASVMRRF